MLPSLKMLSRSSMRGFSLAEVLIAIVIIAILTIGSLSVYSTQIQKARDTERRNDITRIKALLDTVIGEYGAPPGEAAKSRKLKNKAKCDARNTLLDCFKTLKISTDSDLDEMFADPSIGILNDRVTGGDIRYGYRYGSNENSYKICTMLEDQGSSDLNFAYDGRGEPASTAYDNLYCITNTATGGQPVQELVNLEHPFTKTN